MKTTTNMELVEINKLVPYVNNARTHSPEQINKLRSSLREFGFINPVIIDKDYGIIAGHGRVIAAREEGIDKVPCVFVDHLTEAQKKAYIIADNRLALDAGWDEDILKLEFAELEKEGFELSKTGFSDEEIREMIDSEVGARLNIIFNSPADPNKNFFPNMLKQCSDRYYGLQIGMRGIQDSIVMKPDLNSKIYTEEDKNGQSD